MATSLQLQRHYARRVSTLGAFNCEDQRRERQGEPVVETKIASSLFRGRELLIDDCVGSETGPTSGADPERLSILVSM
jgi:hypothetical protein